MDPATLATTVTTLLIPYLTKFGENLAGDAGKKLWETITKKLKDKPAGAGTASEFAEDAENSDNQEAFTLQLKKAFKDDPEFSKMIAELVDQTHQTGIANTGSGSIATNGSISVGGIQISGDANGSIIIGNGNSVTETNTNNPNKSNRKEKSG